MSFIDLATVEVVEEVSENAYMLVEDGGDVKRTGILSLDDINHPQEIQAIFEINLSDETLLLNGEIIPITSCTEEYEQIGVGENIGKFLQCDIFKLIYTDMYGEETYISIPSISKTIVEGGLTLYFLTANGRKEITIIENLAQPM